ncbi:MAG: hypothetical protein HY244_07355, partial [Rhizobiales bacterium]|nr:hypothetical protein [Hyphomicrobiales bacterium]
MLVAKRETFELGAQDRPVPPAGPAPTGSRFTRTLNVLQLLGALIALPVGIGSAYSMYQANFSAEASCKALRVSIVRMLDKNVDAATRHMLVRRDVEAFESTCGTVDPDATAAFKALLAAEKAAPVTNAVAPRAEPQAQTVVSKNEPPLKSKPQSARAGATAPVRNEASLSDAAWVAAVQTALAKRDSDKKPAAQSSAAAAPALAPRPLGILPVTPMLPAASSVTALPAPPVDQD